MHAHTLQVPLPGALQPGDPCGESGYSKTDVDFITF